MTVKAILSAKGRHVTTIEPNADLATAARMLAEKKIGALLITGAEGRVVGILSERDIVRTLSERGPESLQDNVAAIMTRKVLTCTVDETVAAIMERMTAGKFRHLPVVEQGRLAGVISISDVVKFRVEEIERESDALREYIATA